ncbi:MAG TPA: TonB-dependent receptor [Opitutaceae bacterium]|nr:TonB-dependent receptor [Opitutaceae bacterium]
MKPSLAKSLRLLSGLAGVWLLAASSYAQQKPAARTADAPKDDTITLTPFEVITDNDVGYTAANALSGGRVNMPLKDLPIEVSVMPRQFLDDIGATGLGSAVEWTVNVVPSYTQNANSFGTYDVNFRNQGNAFNYRNYFGWAGAFDSYNIESLEFGRGANGVIFGDSKSAGGVPTIWTKRAILHSNKTSVSARVDTYGGYRATVDVNQPLGDKMALRLNLLHDRSQDFVNVSSNKYDAVDLAGTYRITKNDEIRIDGEFGRYSHPLYRTNIADKASFWDGTTSFNGTALSNGAAPTSANLTAAGLVRESGYVYVPGVGFFDSAATVRTNGTQVAMQWKPRSDIGANFPVLPSRKFILEPRNHQSDLHQKTVSVFWDHRFSDGLSSEVAFNRYYSGRASNFFDQGLFSNYQIDVNSLLPNGAANPNYGKAYDQQAAGFGHFENTSVEIHALVNWRFQTSWLTQNFSALGGTRTDVFNQVDTKLARTSGPGTTAKITDAVNTVYERLYFDQAGASIGTIPDAAGQTFAYYTSNALYQRKNVDNFAISSNSQLFNDRLTLQLGARYDHAVDRQRSTGSGVADPVTGIPNLGGAVIAPGAILATNTNGARTVYGFKRWSPSAGAVYFFLPSLGVYTNWSSSTTPNTPGGALLDRTIPLPPKNSSQAIGLRLNLFDGRVVGSMGYYKSKQTGAFLSNSLDSAQMDEIWKFLGHSEIKTAGYKDSKDFNGQGLEFDITANPTRQFRLLWNLALPRSTLENVNPALKSYVKDNLATWQAGANDPNNPNAAQIQSDIDRIKSDIISTGSPGATLNGTYRYISNLYGTYTFDHGTLKDFSIGGGVQMRGPQTVDSVQTYVNGVFTSQPYNYIYARAYQLFEFHTSYKVRLNRKVAATFQINIQNLFNDSHVVYGTGSSSSTGETVVYNVGGLTTNPKVQANSAFLFANPPRKIIFSSTFVF